MLGSTACLDCVVGIAGRGPPLKRGTGSAAAGTGSAEAGKRDTGSAEAVTQVSLKQGVGLSQNTTDEDGVMHGANDEGKRIKKKCLQACENSLRRAKRVVDDITILQAQRVNSHV